jgi:hypothetical protein
MLLQFSFYHNTFKLYFLKLRWFKWGTIHEQYADVIWLAITFKTWNLRLNTAIIVICHIPFSITASPSEPVLCSSTRRAKYFLLFYTLFVMSASCAKLYTKPMEVFIFIIPLKCLVFYLLDCHERNLIDSFHYLKWLLILTPSLNHCLYCLCLGFFSDHHHYDWDPYIQHQSVFLGVMPCVVWLYELLLLLGDRAQSQQGDQGDY